MATVIDLDEARRRRARRLGASGLAAASSDGARTGSGSVDSGSVASGGAGSVVAGGWADPLDGHQGVPFDDLWDLLPRDAESDDVGADVWADDVSGPDVGDVIGDLPWDGLEQHVMRTLREGRQPAQAPGSEVPLRHLRSVR